MKNIIIIALLTVCCSESKLELSDNYGSNLEAVVAYIPIGTDMVTAIKRMSNVDFNCTVEREKTAVLSKGNNAIGHVGPIDFLWCDMQQGMSVARRWRVILILDNEDKVQEHGVTTELVEP